jgi:hypothetical protein
LKGISNAISARTWIKRNNKKQAPKQITYIVACFYKHVGVYNLISYPFINFSEVTFGIPSRLLFSAKSKIGKAGKWLNVHTMSGKKGFVNAELVALAE